MEGLERERSGSTSSVKRRRELEEEEAEAMEVEDLRSQLREQLEEASLYVLRRYRRMEAMLVDTELKLAQAMGKLEAVERKKVNVERGTFVDVLSAPRPRVGKKIVEPRQAEKTAFVYPVDESVVDSEATKKEVKKLIAPKEEGWQIHALRKVRRGGVIIEAGTIKTAEKIKEAAKAIPTIRCTQPARIMPKVRVFDVDNELGEAEIKQRLFKQNLCDAGFTEQQVGEEVKCRFKTPGRFGDMCNWVLEVSSRVRNALIAKGRIYVEFSSCRVVDYLGVTRCFKCQGCGHVAKHCHSAGPQICSHCGDGGHAYGDCAKKEEAPVCAVCKLAKKPCGHRGGTRECPIYLKAVERRVAMTHYNGQ